MTSPIRLLITDLDNTLYDWVSFFASSFYEMVREAAVLLHADQGDLLDQLRDVHRRHHNSEHPFALLETPLVQARFPGLSRSEQKKALDEAFHAFNRKRQELLVLYPTVEDTLKTISNLNVPIVGHTEATVPNAVFRLHKLGIAGLFSKLYAATPPPQEHPDPEFRLEPAPILVRYLAPNERKPDPAIVLDICRDLGVPPNETLYVGDSLARDIGMAQAAGAWAAWARYGTEYDKTLWDRLVRITHWTPEDVARAETARKLYGDCVPNQTLEQFGDVLLHFEFANRGGRRWTSQTPAAISR
jgi:HAD superfamily hydrolase (TIGR01549 family)